MGILSYLSRRSEIKKCFAVMNYTQDLVLEIWSQWFHQALANGLTNVSEAMSLNLAHSNMWPTLSKYDPLPVEMDGITPN